MGKRNKQNAEHQVISTKTERLILKKKEIKEPIFYDPECELAKKCKMIQNNFSNSIFDEEEKQKLIQIQRSNLITNYALNQNNNVDSDGIPLTPEGSEDDQ